MKKLLALIYLVLCLPIISIGQQALTLYGMKNLSQAFYLNPGFQQKNRVHVSIPLGIQSISLNHSGFTLNQALEKTNGDSLIIRPDLAIEKMGKRNVIAFEQSSELLGFGFKIKKKNFISFSASLKSNFIFTYPRDLFRFASEGNGSSTFLGNRASLDGLGINSSVYSEYALGYNRSLNKSLTVGGRFKLLSGITNIHTSNSELGISTDSDTYDITIDGKMAIKSSNSLFFTDTTNKYIKPQKVFTTAAYDFKNIGFAIDAGASYKLNDKLELSASIVDLGMIKWKENIKNYESSSVNYTFKGVDLNSIIIDSVDVGKHLTDTLEKVFGYSSSSESYSTSLYTRFYLGGVYNLNKTFSTSLTLHNQIAANRLRTGAAIAMNIHARNWLNFSINYAAFGRSFRNVGLGLSLKGGPLQFFVISDNILSSINPANTKNLHLAFGLNVSIGPLKDKDGDDIKDKKDACPELFGKPEFNGCPDSDNDSIIDPKDACPQVPGLKDLGGCPDRDHDRITDMNDVCPDDSGLVIFAGCPDRDNDSIIDKNDSCPDLKGLSIFNGCPDTDGDGIKDNEDACPEIAGPLLNQGCPDTDKDGLFDFLDDCPEQYGPKENKGCPWPDTDADGILDKDDDCPYITGPIKNKGCPYQDTDSDGVLDNEDECPATQGPISNKGCPVIEKEVQEILNTAFDDLAFETGKDIIKSVSFPSLNELGEVLKKKSTWNLQISGHTDNVGDDQKNLMLSKKRAEAVKNYLASQGIDPSRLYVLFVGETMPITTNDTPEGRQKNRRVEMKIIFK
jgi:outer membrane protein OmpA-like peptidoglycan-associated protein